MSQMVERVSQAMRKACPFELRDQTAHSMARAAIEGMRKPTEAMCVAGNIPGWDDSVTVGLSEEIWSAMIGVALTE